MNSPELMQIAKQMTRIADELHVQNQTLTVIKNELYNISDFFQKDLADIVDRKRGC